MKCPKCNQDLIKNASWYRCVNPNCVVNAINGFEKGAIRYTRKKWIQEEDKERRLENKSIYVKKALERANNKCYYCGSKSNLEAHHIVPLFAGGTNDDTNLQVLCDDCHKRKHKKGVKGFKNEN
jgi:5-methylcytosine-specific restriction endonuclease McrA